MGVLAVLVAPGVWRDFTCHRTPPEMFAYNGTNGNDGTDQTFIVPDGVYQLFTTLDGAEGGGSGDSLVPGGKGGRVETTLAVTPGEALTIRSGGSVAPSGYGFGTAGWNGGGTGGHGGGAGGGATSIWRGSTLLAIAGGGGGAGDAAPAETTGVGGDGGGTTAEAGADGAPGFGTGGGPGTSSAGGTAGTPVAAAGTDGSSLQGGDGGHDASLGDYGAGGGGGGYYGGGGGGRGGTGHIGAPANEGAGGGGGGSSYSSGTDTTHTAGVRSGHGQITIDWTPLTGLLDMQLPNSMWITPACGETGGHPLAIEDPENPGTWIDVACYRYAPTDDGFGLGPFGTSPFGGPA